ncbi:MAG: PKD domain-containing protein [Bacteroidia bacterium]
MTKVKALFLPLLLFFSITTVEAQGTINAPGKICLGDITNFSYTPPSGLTLSSIAWKFGDGNTSSNNSPSHTYGSIGQYTVSIQANFTNSSTANDTFKLEVFALPKAHLVYLSSSDTCFNDNKLCFVDTSEMASSGQFISNRLIVWGDGTFQNTSSPGRFDTLCHSYAVAAKYSLRMEITDTIGCKSSVSFDKNVVENITVDFTLKDTWVNCDVARIFMYNKSFGAGPSTSHYRWIVDTSALDTGFYFNNPKSVFYTKSRSGTVTLIGYANNACRDTLTKPFSFIVDTLANFITLSDTILCNSSGTAIECNFPIAAKDSICWYRDGAAPLIPPPVPIPQTFTWYWSNQRLGVGIHSISVKVFRGSCIHTIKKNFELLGPFPDVLLIDDEQCYSQRQMFMVDKSIGVNREDCIFDWKISDPQGDNCTANHSKGINLYKNCNNSKDWYLKHWFPNIQSTYDCKFFIQDTVTGCADSLDFTVSTEYCPPIIAIDTFNVCENQYFLDYSNNPLPKYFSLDSGKNWLKYGTILDSNYIGSYQIGFIFEQIISPWAETIGNDSIEVHNDSLLVYDTTFNKQILNIRRNKKDSVFFKVYGNCSPYRVSVFLKDGSFEKGENLRIIWGDLGNIDTTFTTKSKVDSFFHIYYSKGISREIQVYIENEWGCGKRTAFLLERGKNLSKNTSKFINCIYDSVCIYGFIFDLQKKTFWDKTTPNNTVKWFFPEDNITINGLNICYKFNSGGMQAFQMIVNDSFGCIDTLFDTIFIQDVRANIKQIGKLIYCSELKQFFDSSSYLKNPKYRDFFPKFYSDSIKKYSWRFGNDVYNSFQKNPVQSISTSLDSIPASHVVETVSGCSDTINYYIKVIGPKPYFQIQDTIGCGSFEATFINLSRNSKHYIWNFGDSLNNQLQTSSKQNVKFNYTSPGRYYISLIGIDTVFNPFTNKYEACVNTFPDKLFQSDSTRSVLVLPLNKTGITSIDTICVGAPIFFTSLSDTAYAYDFWNMGDSTTYDTTAPSTIQHIYKKQGQFLVKLNPGYYDSIQNTCRDSIQKTIVVLDVKADFDVDPSSKAPLFKFNNKSIPITSQFNWDFGTNGPGNTSTETNPQKNFGNDTGTYNVCLIASIAFGCKDTFCMPIFNDVLSEFGIFNVFTPGNIDGLNDKYDIKIDGESSYQLYIYNRWGELVYEADQDYDNTQEGNWNGKLRNTGPDCPAGTYYYIFKYKLDAQTDDENVLEGVIHLIR